MSRAPSKNAKTLKIYCGAIFSLASLEQRTCLYYVRMCKALDANYKKSGYMAVCLWGFF
jgi:hypothetical protein